MKFQKPRSQKRASERKYNKKKEEGNDGVNTISLIMAVGGIVFIFLAFLFAYYFLK